MLNKRACRKYADPKLKLADNGLLHAEQVDYIIRTAVKLIDHHRVLVLYIYDRAEAEQGRFIPLWTVFQTKDYYVTLARQDDGSLKWRSAAFENLGKDWCFPNKCAFYSARDERRISRYFHKSGGGISALICAQKAIQERRSRERRLAKERKILERMSGVGSLPRGLKSWIHRCVMPAYFLCDHAGAHKPVTGICTSCGHKIKLDGARHNGKVSCPRCHRELTVKSLAKVKYIYNRDTVQVIQRTGPQELVVRIIKAEYCYTGSNLKSYVYENARIFVGLSDTGDFYAQPYYRSNSPWILTDWREGLRPRLMAYQYSFAGDICGHVYCRNLDRELAGTPWQYCPVEQYYQHYHSPMELSCFFRAYLEHPRLEHFVKTGFFNLASDMVYRYHYNKATIDETQSRTHRILAVDSEDVAFLRELDVSHDELRRFQALSGIRDRQRLFLWAKEHNITRDIPAVLKYVSAHQLMKYVDGQYAKLSAGENGRRFQSYQTVLSEYRDYLEMQGKLNYATKNKSVRYPPNLHIAHDRAAANLKTKHDSVTRRNFKLAYQRISRAPNYAKNGLTIVLPSSLDDLTVEGRSLHHCVGSYANRVAKKECIIVFVRRCAEPEKPYYTAEIQDGRVVQLRGLQNCEPTPEVQAFADAWEQNVLRTAA